MKRITALLLAFAMALSLAGCAKNDRQQTDWMENISARAVDSHPDTAAGAQAMTEFGVRLARNSFENGENLLLSPLSVLCALAMTANGAKEQTLKQMEEIFGLPIEALIEYMHLYMQGDGTIPARKEILIHQRDDLAARMAEMQKTLDRLNLKISIYEEHMLRREHELLDR